LTEVVCCQVMGPRLPQTLAAAGALAAVSLPTALAAASHHTDCQVLDTWLHQATQGCSLIWHSWLNCTRCLACLQVRAARRLREGRSKPIDHVARSLFLQGEFDADMSEPYAVLEGLPLDDVKELCDEIKFYKVGGGGGAGIGLGIQPVWGRESLVWRGASGTGPVGWALACSASQCCTVSFLGLLAAVGVDNVASSGFWDGCLPCLNLPCMPAPRSLDHHNDAQPTQPEAPF
jgi:hypothetical protein